LNQPFTHDFPRADIYEILTPDLLHQVIKGTFKDHIVTWVGEYLVLEHGEARRNEILDDIDRRFVHFHNFHFNLNPLFPNLRQFPHGRCFKQWTGDNSKALMKVRSDVDAHKVIHRTKHLLQVYVSAIAGHVPSEMTQAISSFLDVCYIARRANLDSTALGAFDTALAKFYTFREVFHTSGVRPTGFSLPRQHSLSHYCHLIEEFGAPGGFALPSQSLDTSLVHNTGLQTCTGTRVWVWRVWVWVEF
jgi:hypothetical protein